jgi:hypothetical protein
MPANLRRALFALGPITLASALLGCTEPVDADANSAESAVESTNGLMTINGMTMHNGMAMNNGMTMNNGLATTNGMAMNNGLMTTAAGRSTFEYIVRCALPANVSITKQDQNGVSYTYKGSLGFAPQWLNGVCDTNCQEYISACLMAHVNTTGIHVPLFIVSQNSSVGWDLSPDYPNQEGSFFGNIFTLGAHGGDPTKVAAYYCNGKAYDVATVPGRIGANQVNAPYKNPYIAGPYATGTTGYCSDICTAADYPNATAGYKACSGWNNVVTTYRQAAATGAATSTTSTPALSASIFRYFETAFGYCANVNVTNKSTATVPAWTVSYDTGTASQYFTWFAVDSAVGSLHTIKESGVFFAIPPGGIRSFGYCAMYHGAAVAPVVKSVLAQ